MEFIDASRFTADLKEKIWKKHKEDLEFILEEQISCFLRYGTVFQEFSLPPLEENSPWWASRQLEEMAWFLDQYGFILTWTLVETGPKRDPSDWNPPTGWIARNCTLRVKKN